MVGKILSSYTNVLIMSNPIKLGARRHAETYILPNKMLKET